MKNPPDINSARQRKFVAIIMKLIQLNSVVKFPKFVMTQYKEEDEESLSQHFKICRDNDKERTSEIY